MPHQPADDQPAPSVQDNPVFHTAVSCPVCGSMVMCSGHRGAPYVAGACHIDKITVYGRSELASQTGFLELPEGGRTDVDPPKPAPPPPPSRDEMKSAFAEALDEHDTKIWRREKLNAES